MTLENKLNQQYRSQGERQIASLLQRRKMRLEYEPDTSPEEELRRDIWYPDFCYDDYPVYLEEAYQ